MKKKQKLAYALGRGVRGIIMKDTIVDETDTIVCHMTCNSSLKLAFTESVEKQSKMFNYYPLNSMFGNITNDVSFVLILQNN